MRLLFVDDEDLILSGIENALFFAPDDWDADFANSGEKAIEAMNSSSYDVLITDMKMPGLTGADVLEYATANHPDILRVVLSGEVDPVLAARAMPLMHEFVSKPCDLDDLFRVIQRIYTTSRSSADGPARDILGALGSLPMQPKLHAMVQQAAEDYKDLETVAELVATDVGIATTVLKIAGSAFYGFRTPSRTVREAVTRLGTETVAGIVLNAEIGAWVTPGMAGVVARVNAESALGAGICRELLGEEFEQAALAGLLHNVGALVLLSRFPEEYTALGDHPSEDEERAAFGVSHTDVGAYLLEMWNVDDIVVQAARFHHRPSQVKGDGSRLIETIAAVDHVIEGNRDNPRSLDAMILARAREVYQRTRAA